MPSVEISADFIRHLYPSTRLAIKVKMPRIKGTFEILLGVLLSHSSRWMVLSGLRTAMADLRTPRIITPSSTACPPMDVLKFLLIGLMILSINQG